MNEIKIGDVSVVWFGHASFMVTDGKTNIYVDPYVLPDNFEKAGLILVTHEHFDHFKPENIRQLDCRDVIGPAGVIGKLGFGVLAKPGNVNKTGDANIAVVEAYNTNKFRSPGQVFHPRGLGVGYVIELSNTRIYHAGDTDNIQEMSSLKGIDITLLPIGGTYTMNVQEGAEAAESFKPRFAVPMHYNSDRYGISGIQADPEEFAKLLAGRGIVVNVLDPLVQ